MSSPEQSPLYQFNPDSTYEVTKLEAIGIALILIVIVPIIILLDLSAPGSIRFSKEVKRRVEYVKRPGHFPW